MLPPSSLAIPLHRPSSAGYASYNSLGTTTSTYSALTSTASASQAPPSYSSAPPSTLAPSSSLLYANTQSTTSIMPNVLISSPHQQSSPRTPQRRANTMQSYGGGTEYNNAVALPPDSTPLTKAVSEWISSPLLRSVACMPPRGPPSLLGEPLPSISTQDLWPDSAAGEPSLGMGEQPAGELTNLLRSLNDAPSQEDSSTTGPLDFSGLFKRLT